MIIVWTDTDDKGRYSAKYSVRQEWHNPPAGTEDTPAFRARFARVDDAEFRRYFEDDKAARAAEKFASLPVETRIRQVREQMADEIAAADHWMRSPSATDAQRKRAEETYDKLNKLIGDQP